MKEITLWFDVDSTMIHTIPTIVDMYNDKYDKQCDYTKTRKWNFGDSCEGITLEDINEFFGSREFFERVEFTEVGLLYFQLLEKFHKYPNIKFGIISKGSVDNLYWKKRFVKDLIPHDKLILESEDVIGRGILQGEFILIDDSSVNLENCGCLHRVLYADDLYGETEWNKSAYSKPSEDTGIDVVTTAKELKDYILYVLKKENIL